MRPRMRPGRIVLSTLAAVAISMGALGCTTDVTTQPTSDSSTPRPQPSPTGACALITTTEAAKLLGYDTSLAQANPGRTGTTQCTFFAGQSGAGQDSGLDKVIVGVDSSPTAKERFAEAKARPGTTAITGLADDAFSETGATGNVTVIAVLEPRYAGNRSLTALA